MENPINPQPDDNQPAFGTATATARAVNQVPQVDPYQAAMQGEIIIQTRALNSGVKWFYYIAGLSLINSVFALAGSGWSFLAGLAVTQLITGFAVALNKQGGAVITVVAIVLNLIAAGIFFLLGAYGKKRHSWAFLVGMIGYGADTLLCILLGFLDARLFFSAAFHAYALFNLYKGFKASRELSNLLVEPSVQTQY